MNAATTARAGGARQEQQATPRRDAWHAIEGRQFGQCVWQQWSQDRRFLLEGLVHKRSGRVMIVRKEYEERVPKLHSSKSWPELTGVTVYDDVCPAATAWEDYEKEVARIG